MTSKTTLRYCCLCDKPHRSAKSPYCKEHRSIYVSFPSTKFFNRLFKEAKRAGNLGVISKSLEELRGLLDLLDYQRRAQHWNNGKLAFSYDLAHLHPVKSSSGRLGKFVPSNLMLVPSSVNRSHSNTDYSLSYGSSIKPQSKLSLKNRSGSLKSDSAIRKLLLAYLGEELISSLLTYRDDYPRMFASYSKSTTSFDYTYGGYPSELVLVEEIARLAELHTELHDLASSFGVVWMYSDSSSPLAPEIASIFSSVLEGVRKKVVSKFPLVLMEDRLGKCTVEMIYLPEMQYLYSCGEQYQYF